MPNLTPCYSCKAMIEDDSVFCDQCGAELYICPKCKKFGKGAGKRCASCGGELVRAGQTGSEKSDVSDRPVKSDKSDGSDESDVTAPAPEVRYEVPVQVAPAEVVTESEVVAEPETVTDTVTETEPVTEPVAESLTETEPDIAPTADDAPVDIALWRQAFSINDLYLFRHELFRDSDTLLNQALGEIGQATSPLEVRDIMVNRYGIDPRRQAAKEFLNIVTSFFG